mgnify:CR=1 FL=1|tara:strand:+ start:12214 stop:13116 length:903 start_codon:yes stop_codon:yes gene_type:complete
MNELDLSGVAPMRWQEVRRRVTAVREYLELAQPTVSDREAAAGKVGLSLDQFERLIRSWRIHSDPARLDGAGSLARARRNRSDGLPSEVQRIIQRAIEEAGCQAAPAKIYDIVLAQCEKAGLEPPSNNLVWTRIMAARSEATGIEDDRVETLIGRIWLHLPIVEPATPCGARRPELLVAVRLPERTIDACATDVTNGRPPVFEDLDLGSIAVRPIRVAPRDVSDTRTLDIPRVEKDIGANARLARVLGNSIGGLDIAFRLPRKPAATLLKNKLDTVLSPADAALAIVHAIRRHNERVATH